MPDVHDCYAVFKDVVGESVRFSFRLRRRAGTMLFGSVSGRRHFPTVILFDPAAETELWLHGYVETMPRDYLAALNRAAARTKSRWRESGT